MEQIQGLTLNEEALQQVPEVKRPIFIYEWLRFLDKSLNCAKKSDVKECQKKLVEQLMAQLVTGSPGPPTRQLLAQCMATLFSVGDTFLLFDTINKCNDLLKTKDDSPTFLPCRLAATVVVGAMYQKLGRMMGRSYEETVSILTKGLKNAESLTRAETMVTLGKVCKGMGGAAANVHKDIYKACRTCLTDRVMTVKIAAADCLIEMMDHASFLYTTELENMATLCFRALEGANYNARMSISKVLGFLMANTQETDRNKRQGMYVPPAASSNKNATTKTTSLEDALSILGQGFLKGGIGSFLKGTGDLMKGSVVSQDLRVGVSHAYVAMVRTLGPVWLERNLSVVLNHILELASSPKAGSNHTDAVCSRNCVTYILSSILGRMLREKAQLSACKELVSIMARSLNTSDKEEGLPESNHIQHLQVTALFQLGCLTSRLGTVTTSLLTDTSLKLLDTVFSGLLNTSLAVRLASSQCLRQICIAVPSVLTPLIDKCVEALDNYKSSQEAVSGYSAGLAALLGAVRSTPNGIPHTRGKIIFNCGEELLRSASQNSRLSKERTRAGWLLIGAIMSLGSSVVRGLLPRCMLLWRNAFPRSQKELDSEKARGDAFTWLVSLEARAGALATMHSFVISCPDLVTEDIVRRLTVPLESALGLLTVLSSANSPIKSYSGQLKAPTKTVVLRLLEVASALPSNALESSYASLLRLIVGEFSLSDPTTSPTSTSLLTSVCHQDDVLILGGSIPDQLETFIEEQLQPNSAAGSNALEHDHCWLYRPQPEPDTAVGPLPLGVSVIDQSLVVFGKIFPRAAQKHRLQMLNHFTECIKTAKTNKLEVLQINIFTALLSGLKGLVDDKTSFGGKELTSAATGLISGVLTSNNPLLRCAAGESLGRIAQVVSDNKFIAEMAQHSFDFLKTARDVASRTGHSFALGCLHRYVGSLGSSQHLHTSVSILLALAQDNASPVVQAWALHALALIADSGGPMFRDFVEPTLSCVLKLLLTTSSNQGDVLICLGKLLAAIITTLGPELSASNSTISKPRSNILIAAAVMQAGNPVVQSEAIACLQQLHMFAPGHLDLNSLVPELVKLLTSSHLSLRRASVACLRQLSQREAKEVCEIASSFGNVGIKDTHCVEGIMAYSDSGLPGMLFSLLDQEEDSLVVKHAQETITSILIAMSADNLTSWLSLCQEVLTVSVDSGNDNEEDKDDDGDDVEFTHGEDSSVQATVQPRWTTRVFAAICLRKMISDCCEGDRAHFDLSLAKEVGFSGAKSDFLVLHLSELVRMCFMAATSDSDQLRLEGLLTMQVVIDRFADTLEPEFPGHVILEQYQAQVGAALRPAFATDTASHVTATACAVCSTWISSGVARDLNDLRRVYQLLVTSLAKLKKGSSSNCYNESASTLEKLSILKAWAEVYIVSMITNGSDKNAKDDFSYEDDFGDFNSSPTEEEINSLTGLVAEELPSLSKHWLAALKDHALLSLAPEFKSQLPYEGGAFYTNDTIELARPHYKTTWAPILNAASIWLSKGGGFENVSAEKIELDVTGSANIGLGPANATSSGDPEEINRSRFNLLLGVSMEALCSPRTGELTSSQLNNCLGALASLLESVWARVQLTREEGVLVELCNVLHRQLLSQDNTAKQEKILEVVSLAVKSASENLANKKKTKLKELFPANQSFTDIPAEVAGMGEGGETGKIKPGKSMSFAILEVCLCVLVRYFPDISPRAAQSSSVIAMQARSRARSNRGSALSPDQQSLISAAVSILSQVPGLCSPQGTITIIPTVLYLITGTLKESAIKPWEETEILAETAPVVSCLTALQTLVSMRYTSFPEVESRYFTIMQSGLLRVLDLAKTAPQEAKLDEVSLLLAVKVYLLYGTPEMLSAANIKYPSVNAFSSSLQSQDIQVQKSCLKILSQIFKEAAIQVSVPYIQATSPQVIQWCLQQKVNHPTSEQELILAAESLQLLETLLDIAEADKKCQLLTVHIPILINFLVDEKLDINANQFKRTLHESALTRLTKIGVQFPADFQGILNSNADMRQRVERAAIQNRERQKAKTLAAQNKHAQPTQPSIKLKMDFSNFK